MTKRRRLPQVPPRRNVSKKEVQALLKQGGAIRDALWDGVFATSYTLADGSELVVNRGKGSGTVYPDRAAYAAYLADMDSYQPQHVLADMLPQGEQFPEEVPRLIEEFARRYEIPRASLDCSWESLKLVERAVCRLGPEDVLGSEELYPPLVAYLGEVIRKHVGGHWQMQLAQDDGKTWEPYILGDNGLLYNPFMILAREVDEGRTSLVRATRSEVSTGGQRPLPPKKRRDVGLYIREDGSAVPLMPCDPWPEDAGSEPE